MIDDASAAGAWRAALEPDASCAACGQSVCPHSDPEYLGIVPAREGVTPCSMPPS